jgi:hypothetical protein
VPQERSGSRFEVGDQYVWFADRAAAFDACIALPLAVLVELPPKAPDPRAWIATADATTLAWFLTEQGGRIVTLDEIDAWLDGHTK